MRERVFRYHQEVGETMINIIGTIWGTQGYAIHSRNLARAIDNECGAKLTTDLIQGWETQVNDQELKMLKENGEYDTNIIIAQPNAWRMYTERNKTNIGFLVWEGDKIPKSWMKDCLNPEIDLIFVPSSHTLRAVSNSMGCLSEEECKILLEKLK